MIVATTAALAAALYLGPLAGPAGAAPVDSVVLSFSPTSVVTTASITANGVSTATVTATVSLLGVPVVGETVTVSSTDPGELISPNPATDNGDGTYTATITSSTTVSASPATITATDTTASPNQVTSAPITLTQTPGPAAHVNVSLVPSSIVANGTSTTTATATVTDANVNAVPGDTVTFSPTPVGGQGAVTDNGDGTYTATIRSTTTAGQVAVTATDHTGQPITSGPAGLKQIAGPATSIAVQLSPTSIVANGSSSATATAVVTDAHGNPIPKDSIAFSSSDPADVVSGTSMPTSGTYTASIRSSTTVGTPTITATDDSVTGLSGQATLTQSAAGSTVVLSASPTKAITNQQVTLIATVQTTSGPAAGAVTFHAGAAPVSGCVSLPVAATGTVGTVTCTTSFAAGSPPGPLTAAFTPTGASSLAATSAAVSVTLASAPTTITLASPATTRVGANVSYSATVATSAPGAVAPGGTVSFFDGTKPIPKCAARTLAASVATCPLTYAKAGSHVITAHYAGDGNFAASVSAPGKTAVTAAKPKPRATVNSTMTWSFLRAKTYSEVISLVVSHPPAGGAAVLQCSGHGCPFASRTVPVPSHRKCSKGKCVAQAASAFDLTSQLKSSKLAIGAKLVIMITEPKLNAKYYRLTITTSGPEPFIGCFAKGHSKPNQGCRPPA